MSAEDPLNRELFPNGEPSSNDDFDRLIEMYKIMITSSESLVSRRQAVNTFFLTINGALLTAIGLIVSTGSEWRLQALGIFVLTSTGAILSWAWCTLINSFGQLNSGKFAVINRIEQHLPAAIYHAEWKALKEGRDPKTYRTFTSREIWAPRAFTILHVFASLLALLLGSGALSLLIDLVRSITVWQQL
ncbi:hypothetical protein H0B56_11720 [Haloechinothrix sp. YIM 98757]|uniref:Uncharacterized protein n=1 Tax=Haloechinothrix aidingensis TaxID=2752311 RepID=A0A838AAE8_9PSEU|nr:hypothetical protein [Haloechinothrix aidingensis]MBA0126209.1 hypothetical protein [Haloechinothrix aidingensis]